MTQRPLLAAALALVLVTLVPAAGRGGAEPKEAIVLDGVTYLLAWEQEEGGATLREYLPEGETLEHWSHMVAVREWSHLSDPSAAADALLEALARDNPLARSQKLAKPATGEVLVDFVTWPADGSFAEFNVFRYGKAARGKGIVAFQLAWRGYDDREAFFEALKRERPRLLEVVAKGTFAASPAR